MQYFDLLSKGKKIEDEVALRKIDGLKKSQLSNLKANLYKQILSCLRLLERNKIDELQVREQIDFAKILYEKGLYKPCLDLLDKAKKLALKINYETLALSILYFEKRIESQHVTGSMSAKADFLSSQSNELLEQIAMTNSLSNASLLLYGRYLRHGYIKNKEEYLALKQYFDELIPEYQLDNLAFYQKLYLYQSYVWFYNMCQDFPNSYRYSQKWIDLYHEYSHKIISVTTPYLKGLHNLLNALFMATKKERFKTSLDILLAFNIEAKPNVTRNERSIYELIKTIQQLNYIYLYSDLEQEDPLLSELEKIIKDNIYSWDLNRMLVFYYKLGSLYYVLGQLDKSAHYFNKICNKEYAAFREDIQSFARIMTLIIHFDQGNEELISYQVKSLYRFLSKIKELEIVQKEIISFLRNTPKMLQKDMKKEFTDLRGRLLILKDMPYQKRPFLYLDITTWLESKIEGVPMRKLLR